MIVTATPTLDLDFVRARFPSLASGWTFFDNAGGAQILGSVVERINEYLLTSNVQLGASYAVSRLAGERLQQATAAVAALIGAADASEVVIGPSATALFRILALSLGRTFAAGDEVIVTNCDHEANIGAWVELERLGVVIKFWHLNAALELDLAELEELMTPRTRLVALTHASNILGTINPIARVAKVVHARGAFLCVDGVAFAPHRAIDVRALDVDFYVFSCYKVYGPHLAVLYGKRELLVALPGFNHYFIGETDIPYKFQPGGANYELSYGLLGLGDYLEDLAVHHLGMAAAPDRRGRIEQSFELMSRHEETLSVRLLDYLKIKPGVRVIGRTGASRSERMPTIAFVVEDRDSGSIPLHTDNHQIAIRHGDFYAKRLIADLGFAERGGVVRVSMVHYNTLQEVDGLIDQLEALL